MRVGAGRRAGAAGPLGAVALAGAKTPGARPPLIEERFPQVQHGPLGTSAHRKREGQGLSAASAQLVAGARRARALSPCSSRRIPS
jgi:hypothetical protein